MTDSRKYLFYCYDFKMKYFLGQARDRQWRKLPGRSGYILQCNKRRKG